MNVSLFLLWLVLGACVCQEPAGVGAPRGIALNRRGGLPRALGSKASTTTSTPPPPPQDEAEESEYEDVAEEEGEGEGSVGATEPPTTQGSKLKSGIVRPFRSNDDLLATLKRRRAEAATNKHHDQQQSQAAAESQQPAVEPSKGIQGKRKFNLNNNSATTAPQEETTAATKTARSRFNNGRVAFKTNPAPSEGNVEASSAEVKPRPGYRSRKF